MEMCDVHASCPEALPLRDIRKQQRRYAALLQRSDMEVYIPKFRRHPPHKPIHVCVCSRLDPDGIYRNPADDYIRQGLENVHKSRKTILPGLSGLKSKSKSVETLVGNDDIDFSDVTASGNGSFTERIRNRIEMPRVDPLGKITRKMDDVVRPKDIENFRYSILQEKDDFVLPPIPQRVEPKKGVVGRRQSSFTMYVPNNTPVSTANKERHAIERQKLDKLNTNKASEKNGTRTKREKSFSNFVNKFGDIIEEGSEKQYNNIESKSQTSHDRGSFRYTHSDAEEDDDDENEQERKDNVCRCHFPDWVQVPKDVINDENRSLADSGVGTSIEHTHRSEDTSCDVRRLTETPGEDPITHRCRKCGKAAPGGEHKSTGKADILKVGHNTHTSSRNPKEGDLYLIQERSLTLEQAIASGDVKLTNDPEAVNSIERFKRYTQSQNMNTTSKENSGVYSERGYIRDNTTYSSDFRRVSVASSMSEMSEAMQDQVWRDRLSHQVNGQEGSQIHRERSGAPSVVIRSYGPSSHVGDDDYHTSQVGSPSKKLRTPKSSSNSFSYPNVVGTPPSMKSDKRITFEKSVSGTPESRSRPVTHDSETDGLLARSYGAGMNVGRVQLNGKQINSSSTYSKTGTPNLRPSLGKHSGDKDSNVMPLGTNAQTLNMAEEDDWEDRLDQIPKEAYERALARAQVDQLPDNPSYYYFTQRITKPHSFSYFEPFVKLCPCCNKPIADVSDHKPEQDNKVLSKETTDKKKGKGSKKGKKTKTKKFNEMRHIFGSQDVYDYYPGGKHSLYAD